MRFTAFCRQVFGRKKGFFVQFEWLLNWTSQKYFNQLMNQLLNELTDPLFKVSEKQVKKVSFSQSKYSNQILAQNFQKFKMIFLFSKLRKICIFRAEYNAWRYVQRVLKRIVSKEAAQLLRRVLLQHHTNWSFSLKKFSSLVQGGRQSARKGGEVGLLKNRS